MKAFDIFDFVAESNRIERILRVSDAEICAHERFLEERPSIASLVALVQVLQPDAKLRDRVGLNVWVGQHVPPPGGPKVYRDLKLLLEISGDPYTVHVAYETLHPFTDGNGRSGRALWLHMMGGPDKAPLGFLHHWYYQSLQAAPCRQKPTPGPRDMASINGWDWR